MQAADEDMPVTSTDPRILSSSKYRITCARGFKNLKTILVYHFCNAGHLIPPNIGCLLGSDKVDR